MCAVPFSLCVCVFPCHWPAWNRASDDLNNLNMRVLAVAVVVLLAAALAYGLTTNEDGGLFFDRDASTCTFSCVFAGANLSP